LIALNATPRALRQSITVGYQPPFDVNARQEGTPNKPAQLCNEIMRNYGHAPYGTRVAEGQARFACESFFWLKAVADKARDLGLDVLKPPDVRKAVEALGKLEGAQQFTERFGVNRYDGAETYRDMTYNSSCECFEYTSGLRPFYQKQPPVYP
jgi:hypothetical protein